MNKVRLDELKKRGIKNTSVRITDQNKDKIIINQCIS